MTERPWLLFESAEDGYSHAAPRRGGDAYCGQKPTFPLGIDADPTCSGCAYETRQWELRHKQH